MIIFNEVCSQTFAAVMLVSSVLLAILFGVLYFGILKKRSTLMLFCANILQLVIVSFLYTERFTGDIGYLMLGNIANVLLVTIWIYAIFLIFKVKTTLLVLLAINAVNVIQALVFFLSMRTNYIVNVLSAFLIATTCIYGIGKILLLKKKVRQEKEVICTVSILGLFGAVNLVRGIYRLLNPLHISSFSQIDASVTFFLIVSLAFSFVLNFAVLFMNFKDLVLKDENQSLYDELLGVVSKKTFFMMLNQKLAESRRGRRNLAVALLCLDDYKRIKDTFGHAEGEKGIKQFAKKVTGGMRENDIIGRIKEDEFMIILEADKDQEALTALNRIKNLICESEWVDGEKLAFSCGYMMISKEKSTMKASNIVKIVEKKMLEAKDRGKNRIV